MPESTTAFPENIECPLCLGKGMLSRTEVLERLGMKDFARVAQLSAEEAVRLLLKKERDAEQSRWAKFDSELVRRLAEVTAKHDAELQRLQTEKSELAVRLERVPEERHRHAGQCQGAGTAGDGKRASGRAWHADKTNRRA